MAYPKSPLSLLDARHPQVKNAKFELLKRMFTQPRRVERERAINQLKLKGGYAAHGLGQNAKPLTSRKKYDGQEFSALNIGRLDRNKTHYRDGAQNDPGRIKPPKRDRERLDDYDRLGQPGDTGFFGHNHPQESGRGGALSGAGGDAGFFSSNPRMDQFIVESPGSRVRVDDIPDWKGTLEKHSFPEVKAQLNKLDESGRQPLSGQPDWYDRYNSTGPQALRRAASVDEASETKVMFELMAAELKEKFPELTRQEIHDQIRRTLVARQAKKYPDQLDYEFEAMPNDIQLWDQANDKVLDMADDKGVLRLLDVPRRDKDRDAIDMFDMME